MRRILSVTCLFMLLWCIPTFAAVQLCGFADNLADALITTGLDDPEGGPFHMITGWQQVVPTLYNLMGSGLFASTPNNVFSVSGGLVVVNNSEAFQNNPICTVSPVVQRVAPDVDIFVGSAELRCFAGGIGPFNVTITFFLSPCNNPGPFVSTSGDRYDAGLPAAGEMPNEYRAR